MGLLVSGQSEFKGYCAVQLTASDFNLVHEMFQFGSSLFPEKEEENDAILCWYSHKRKYFVPCQLLSKLMMLRDNHHRWRLSFQAAVASPGFLWTSLAPYMGHQFALLAALLRSLKYAPVRQRFSEVQNELTDSSGMMVH